MIDGLDRMMQFQTDALRLRSHRQELLSANIANSDTPGYKAVDFDFAQALEAASKPPGPLALAQKPGALLQGSQGHAVFGMVDAGPTLLYRMPGQSSIDGNSVEMDAERARFADNTVRYETAMRALTAQIKTMLAALQG